MAEDEPKGVVVYPGPLPPVAPGPIASSIKAVTFAALGELPPGTTAAMVRLTHDQGAELVFAHRSRDGRWTADLWVGKNFARSTSIEWAAEARVLF